MGCGHSKINIYPRKSRSKNNSKKVVTPEKTESEEEDGIENELDRTVDNLDDCDQNKKTIKVKPFGGPLLAQTEISSSQQDFFRMLDEKIQNGPDYNSESESERAAEAERLKTLLKDWETASAGSRSLPTTPRRKLKVAANGKATKSAGANRVPNYQISQTVVHQTYGVAQVSYRQIPNYVTQSPSHQLPTYPSALQYQAISPMYNNQPPSTYQRQYTPSYSMANQQQQQQQQQPPVPQPPYGSPLKAYISNSPKHIVYEQSSSQTYNSPSHKLYGSSVVQVGSNSGSGGGGIVGGRLPPPPPPTVYSNGEIQYYNHHHHQYQQYKDAREQVLVQNQSIGPSSYRMSHQRNYQTSISIPVGMQSQQTDNNIHRNKYEMT